MATPSGKTNPGATPTHAASSPFPLPTSAPMGRGLSHKSPSTSNANAPASTKTPSAAHHQTHLSVSSSTQQFPTPLAATAGSGPDDSGVPFSSPSALLALGLGGITPSPAPNLTLNEGDIPGLGIPIPGLNMSMSASGPRDNEEERRRNLSEVMRLLRLRVAGRGVCREGVERLGRLEGLECMWQDDNLSIAGNFVDLEIEFWHGREYVKDVVLRYATPDAAEGEVRKEATAVLMRNLLQPPEEQEMGFWKDPGPFHENLKHLARMDHLSQLVNCFQALEGLNESLQKIYEEESAERRDWESVCTGVVGKPCMHLKENLGLSLQYWAEQRRVLDSEKAKKDSKMEVDGSESEEEEDKKAKFWRMVIECEEGYPSLRISKEWVKSPIFTEGSNESQEKSVNWADPPPTLVSPMNESGVMSDSETPNRRFVAHLEPPVDLPVHAAMEVYRILETGMPQTDKLYIFDSLLSGPKVPIEAATKTARQARRRQREVYTFDEDGKSVIKKHDYEVRNFDQVAGRTLKELPFSHPRQLVAIIPILRQYILLASLLRRISPDDEEKEPEAPQKEEKPTAESKPMPTHLSNKDPVTPYLVKFLKKSPSEDDQDRSEQPDEPLKVDISVRTPVSAPPSVFLLFRSPHSDNHTDPVPITMRIDILPGGRLDVTELSGSPDTDLDKLRGKLAGVLTTCEDLGLLAEWVLRWVRRKMEK